MKKILLTLVATLIATGMFAIKPISLDGSFNVKKCKGSIATYSINWDGTKVGEIDDGVFVKGSMPIAEWLAAKDEEKKAEGKAEDANYVRDWEAIKDEANKYFKEEWNDEFGKKGLRLTNNDSEAQYNIEFVIDGLDWGNIGGMFAWGNAGGAIIIGHADLTNRATGERVARFNINHVQGSGHFSDRYRILLVMHQLVDEIEDIY